MSCNNLIEGQHVHVEGNAERRVVTKIDPNFRTGLGQTVHEVVTEGPGGDTIFHFDGQPSSARPIDEIKPI